MEDFVDRKVALENEVAAVFDLADGVEAAHGDERALLGRELRSQQQRPVVESLTYERRAEPVGRRLQRSRIVDREKSVVVFAEADPGPIQLLLDERVALEIVGGLEPEEQAQPHPNGPQVLFANVEVVVSK